MSAAEERVAAIVARLEDDAAAVVARVSDDAAGWFVRHGHFDRINRDPRRYCVANWGGHPDSDAHALGRPLMPDESAALEACIRARLASQRTRSDDDAVRARVAGRVAIANRTVWNIEIGPCRFRCVLDSRLCLYVMEARQPGGGYDEIGRGTDPRELLGRLAFSDAVKRLLKVSP